MVIFHSNAHFLRRVNPVFGSEKRSAWHRTDSVWFGSYFRFTNRNCNRNDNHKHSNNHKPTRTTRTARAARTTRTTRNTHDNHNHSSKGSQEQQNAANIAPSDRLKFQTAKSNVHVPKYRKYRAKRETKCQKQWKHLAK